MFLILDHPPLVSNLAGIIFHGNEAFLAQQPTDISGIERVCQNLFYGISKTVFDSSLCVIAVVV